MAKQQVFSEQEVDFGNSQQILFWNWAGDNSTVPPDSILDVTTATFNYFPTGNGSVGRADLCGRDSGNDAVWRFQIVYIEPLKTVHLTFPKGLMLKAGGHVEIGFTSDGPGTIFVSVNGKLYT
jgi:hypothetical protein